MFGDNNPWLTVEQHTLRDQWGNQTDLKYIWERMSGYVDKWQKGSVNINTTDGDVQVCLFFSLFLVLHTSEGYISTE